MCWAWKPNSWLRSLEGSNWHLTDIHVSKLTNLKKVITKTSPELVADHAGVCLLLDNAVLLLQSFFLNILLVAVLQPLDGVHIPQEGLACLVKVASIGGGGGVTGCGGKHIHIRRQQPLENISFRAVDFTL